MEKKTISSGVTCPKTWHQASIAWSCSLVFFFGVSFIDSFISCLLFAGSIRCVCWCGHSAGQRLEFWRLWHTIAKRCQHVSRRLTREKNLTIITAPQCCDAMMLFHIWIWLRRKVSQFSIALNLISTRKKLNTWLIWNSWKSTLRMKTQAVFIAPVILTNLKC